MVKKLAMELAEVPAIKAQVAQLMTEMELLEACLLEAEAEHI